VILAGLEQGERVVVSGQFLIDSEANLRGALERLSGESPGETP
jgi:Cu(I)/Ag(I) efflux system membrane fusion protein